MHVGPVTRARVKKFRNVLSGFIQEVEEQELRVKSIEGDELKSSNCVIMLTHES